jgi:hypothetical protein
MYVALSSLSTNLFVYTDRFVGTDSTNGILFFYCIRARCIALFMIFDTRRAK